MQIAINKTNEAEIVAELVEAAGRATYTTIRDWESFDEAFKAVLADIKRRFRVDDVDMRAIFTGGGTTAKVTELTFRRSSGVWYLEKARSKRTSCAIDLIKYEVSSYAYERFWLSVKDGRSMKSVERRDDHVPSAHEKIATIALQAQRTKSRTRARHRV